MFRLLPVQSIVCKIAPRLWCSSLRGSARAFARASSSSLVALVVRDREHATGATAATAAALATVMIGGRVAKSSDDVSHELYADEQRTVAVFEKTSSSVVHIHTFVETKEIVLGRKGFHLDLNEIQQGAGSGFAWDEDHIVTNFHVIKDADRAMVVLPNNISCEAALVGADPDVDIAVLKLDTKDSKGKIRDPLSPLERGHSRGLHVGQRVFAIGNPFGFDQTLTTGIVSGVGREMRGISGRMIRGLIQTDAAINPGNSGGPLLNARGRLIGVNTMIASPSGAFSGVGFAIPVDTVVRVVQQLIRYGCARHAYFGIAPMPDHVVKLLSQWLQREGREGLEGVMVRHVDPGSPADEIGLRPTQRIRSGVALGDEILCINGTKVCSVDALMEAVDSHNVGDIVEVSFRRHDTSSPPKDFVKTIKLVERPAPRHDGGGNRGGRSSINGGSLQSQRPHGAIPTVDPDRTPPRSRM